MLGGKRLSSDESEALWTELEKVVSSINEDAARVTDADRPWMTPGADALDRRTLASWVQGLAASERCKVAMDAMMTADNGVRTEWQSYLGNLAMIKGHGGEKDWTDSEVYRCKGGNQLLARRLASAVGDGRVLLNSAVEAVTVREKTVSVKLANGRVIEADDVIVTAPAPVWNKIAFDPALPAALAPQIGINVKCLIAVQNPFWRRAELAPDFALGRADQHDLACDRRSARRRHGHHGLFRRAGCRYLPGVASRTSCRELARRTIEGVHRHPSRVRQGPVHGLAIGHLGAGIVFIPGTGSGHHDGTVALECAESAPVCGRAYELRIHGLHGRCPALGSAGGPGARRT